MKRQELVNALRNHAALGNITTKGEGTLALFFAAWLEKLRISHDENYWSIDHYLPELVVAAVEYLRMGKGDLARRYRRQWEAEVGEKMPNITDLGESHILRQNQLIMNIGHLLGKMTGNEWVESQINNYCNAQEHVLQQTFDKFLRKVYWRGLYKVVDDCNKKGMKGKFGGTELRTYVMAGRIMFTFARKNPKSMWEGGEDNVSFVGEDGDPLALGAGAQSVYADLPTALSMIEEVIAHWPDNRAEQKRIFRGNQRVMMDAVAAMQAAKKK